MNFNFGVFTIIIVVIVVGLLSIIAATRQPEPLVDPWPSFTMVFEEYRYPNGYPENSTHEPIKDYDTWKLEYINLRNWKLTYG